MNANAIRKTILRELTTIADELESYRDESDIWKTVPGISNSTGTLALHVAGNLQHFIGADLGRTGYTRDREAEFSRRHVPRSELIAQLNSAAAVVDSILPQLTEDDLAREFPERVGGISLSTAEYLTHLACHLAYHAGQLNYHRRIITEEKGSVSAVNIAALSSGDEKKL